MSDDTKPHSVYVETINAAAITCRFCNTDPEAFAAAPDADTEKPFFRGRPAVIVSAWQWIAIVLSVGVTWIVYWLRSLAVSYEITSQRFWKDIHDFFGIADSAGQNTSQESRDLLKVRYLSPEWTLPSGLQQGPMPNVPAQKLNTA